MNKGIIHYSNRPKNINKCVGEKFNILFVRLNHFLGINNIIKGCPFTGQFLYFSTLEWNEQSAQFLLCFGLWCDV